MEKDEIIEKLDTIIGLLAIQNKEKDDQIRILYSLGFTSAKIGMLTGMNAASIRRIKSTKLKKKR